MAIQFPDSSQSPFTYTSPEGSVTVYYWDGEKWISSSSGDTPAPTLQEVTDAGNVTDTAIQQGTFNYADADSYGTVLEQNGGIRAKIKSDNTHSSYTAYLGNTAVIDFRYDGSGWFGGQNIKLNTDGSATFTGEIEADSIDGGEYEY